jgi:hypothetical protein
MSANLKLLNIMMGLLQPMLASPNEAVSQAAGEEMQELLKRRQKLLGLRGSGAAATEGAGRKAAVLA